MSTIKSSDEHLTLNADGSSKDIKFQANGVEKASISSAGAFTSTTIDATKLTGDLPAISGAALTGLSASDATKLPLAGGTMTGDLILGDGIKLEIGSATGGDLRLYHESNNSYVNNQGSGDLLIRGNDVKIQDSSSGHNMGVFIEDGGVELYHNNVKKLETTSGGVTVTDTVRTLPTSTTATGWNFDTSGATISCTQNTAIKIGNCGASGMLLINDTTLNGQMNILLVGGGVFTFLGNSGSWAATSSPSTSQVGFYRSGSQIYVKNGKSATVQLGLMTFRTRTAQ
jgi:hypothetical protein